MIREIAACRSCGSTRLDSVLDLGSLCISDFVMPGAQEDKAPLELVCCHDCTLVQLRHTVDRDRLYRDYYYRSGTNESMVAALKDVVRDVLNRDHTLASGMGMVLDIGANDGTLLRMYPKQCLRHGFEPSGIAREVKDVSIVQDYFPPQIDPPAYLHEKYDAITSIAMFYDLDDPNAFVAGIKDWLHPNGIWVCQFQDLHSMLSVNGFDNICHEHLTYWGMEAFTALVARHGMHVADISHNRVNGGSIRYIVKHGQSETVRPDPIRAHEFAFQLRGFGHCVEALKQDTIELLQHLRGQGKQVYGYGASTKGNTLLQYYGIGADLLTAVADRNPDKWGRLTAGSHIPIISEEEMRAAKPDYLFVLPWHFLDSFKVREAAFGGEFIVPLPKLTLGGAPCQSTAAGPYASSWAATGSATL